MAIMKLEDFVKGGQVKRLGQAPVQNNAQKNQNKPGFADRVKQSFSSGIDYAKQGLSELDKNDPTKGFNPIGFAEGALKLGAGAVEAAFSPVTAALQPVVEPTIGRVVKATANKISDSKNVQSFANSQIGQLTARITEDLNNLNTLAGLVAGVKGTGQAGKAALPTVGKGLEAAGDAVTVAGRATEGIGADIYKSAITPTVQEAERLLNYKANTPLTQRIKNTLTGAADNAPITRGQTALEGGLMGRATDIGVQAKRATANVWNKKIAPALKQSQEFLTQDDLFAPIKKKIESTVEMGRKQDLLDAFNLIKEEYKDFGKVTLEQAQKVKEGLAEFVPDKAYRGKPVASAYRTLQNEMAGAIRRKIYDSIPDGRLKRAYLDYSNLLELQKIGVKAISEAGQKGGFGGFWTTVYDMATIPVKTVGGQVLYRVGNKLEFVGQKGIKNFGEFLRKNKVKIQKK